MNVTSQGNITEEIWWKYKKTLSLDTKQDNFLIDRAVSFEMWNPKRAATLIARSIRAVKIDGVGYCFAFWVDIHLNSRMFLTYTFSSMA